MPAPPSAAELWPRRFRGLSAKKASEIVARASAMAGAAMKRSAALPRISEVRPADQLAALIAADPHVARLIGSPVAPRPGAPLPSAFTLPSKGKKPRAEEEDEDEKASVWPDTNAPSWIAIERGGGVFPAIVRIGFRGARVVAQSEPDKGAALVRKTARGKDAVYSLGVAKNQGWKRGQWHTRLGVEGSRLYSFEALQEAADAAAAALRRAGCAVRAPHVEQLHGGQSAMAEIWVRTLSPALALAPSMAR